MVFNDNYLFLSIFLVVGLMIPAVPMLLSRIVAPSKPSLEKNAIYECGVKSTGDSWMQFNIQYYLYAIIFIVFEVEVLYLFPWAVLFKTLGIFGIIEMGIFVGILSLGLVYAWKKGFLKWE